MSDRELLELAAKAARMRLVSYNHTTGACGYEGSGGKWWNPLTDDGDALRLAVNLNMRLSVWDQDFMHHNPHAEARVDIGGGSTENVINEAICADPCAATRRAIVRAAAEIGKTL